MSRFLRVAGNRVFVNSHEEKNLPSRRFWSFSSFSSEISLIIEMCGYAGGGGGCGWLGVHGTKGVEFTSSSYVFGTLSSELWIVYTFLSIVYVF